MQQHFVLEKILPVVGLGGVWCGCMEDTRPPYWQRHILDGMLNKS